VGDGFSLVELLIAMLILQVGVLSLMSVIPLTQVQVAKAENESRATQLVRQQLETLGSISYSDSLLVGGGPYLDPRNPIEGRFDRCWTIVDDTPITGCKTVTVQVAWNDPVGPRAISATTVVARY
jgi:type IV pilus assembly protein PilV